jgi:hypothetical protein
VNAANATQCLGLAAVANTSEFRRAALVACDGPTARWRGDCTQYLNMTAGSLTSCAPGLAKCGGGLALDAAPRATANVFAGPLASGGWAALLVNRADVAQAVALDFALLPGQPGAGTGVAGAGPGPLRTVRLNATEVWTGVPLGGTAEGQLVRVLRPHASLFVTLMAP